jgi:hypothetical protein
MAKGDDHVTYMRDDDDNWAVEVEGNSTPN